MRFTRLGNSGLEVSALCFGCMSVGVSSRGPDSWTLDQHDAEPLIQRAIDAGINFFDTANVYSDGTSEEIVGNVLNRRTRRDSVVIATKVFGATRQGPNGGGLSRKAVVQEVDHSLKRLNTDYIDLLYIHRWDPHTPINETLDVMDRLISDGKVRYWGASSMYAWQFAKLLFTADLIGTRRPIAMQDHYNLLAVDEEREMHPLCADQGIGVIAWSPLARGRLARPPAADRTARSTDDAFGDSLYDSGSDVEAQVRQRVARLAQQRGVPMAGVSLSWILGKKTVTAPVVGSTSTAQLAEALGSLDVSLSEDEIAYLEEPRIPERPVGY